MKSAQVIKSLSIIAMLISLSFQAKAETMAVPLSSLGEDPKVPSEDNGMISLVDVAPPLYYQLRRYPKFYGDENTTHGDWFERSYLLGDFGGMRNSLVDRGIYFDMSLTQFFQSNLGGGKNTGRFRNNGTMDYWLTVDTGKAGLWSAGGIFMHAESSWDAARSINGDVGSLLPPTYDATMPTPGESKAIALSELYLAQALSEEWLLITGKVDWAGLGDTNLFANNERTQFSYTGLVNNPILGAFIPYTSLGLAGVWTPSKEHTVALLGIQSTGTATTSGFDNFNGDYTAGVQYQFSPMLGDSRPGNYRVLVGYNTKDIARFDIDPRHLIAEIIGEVPVAKKSENYACVVNFDQYLWVRDGGRAARRRGLPPVGIGIFGRAGWTPKDRNVIDQFYSFGIGGYGMLIPDRDNDQWGVGWGGTHISGDLRDNLRDLGRPVDDFEHGFEAFYNFELTPATHLTLNAQLIDTPVRSRDTAIAFGGRLQIDF